jgi:nucleotide-binding universal stress UspA family protein
VQKYYDDDANVAQRAARERLERSGVPAKFIHEIGNPADLIARHATTGRYDLIAMGSHGHGAVGNLVLGSVATKVLAICKTPVLLVR